MAVANTLEGSRSPKLMIWMMWIDNLTSSFGIASESLPDLRWRRGSWYWWASETHSFARSISIYSKQNSPSFPADPADLGQSWGCCKSTWKVLFLQLYETGHISIYL
jgi:hypothetical protein